MRLHPRPALLARLRAAQRKYRKDTDGTMSVELLWVLPFLAYWFAASFVFYEVFLVHGSNEKSGYTVADLVSRQASVDSTFIDGMDTIFERLMQKRGETWLRVSSVKYHAAITSGPDAAPERWEVLWSEATKGRQALQTNSIMDLELYDYIPRMTDQETVILTETFTFYPPLLFDVLPEMDFNSFIVTRPRFVSEVLFTGTPEGGSLAGSSGGGVSAGGSTPDLPPDTGGET